MLLYEALDSVFLEKLNDIEDNFRNFNTKQEALHDLRVSTRRFLSYLECLKNYINFDRDTRRKVKFLIKSTNRLRNHQTLIEKINALEIPGIYMDLFEKHLKKLYDQLNQKTLNMLNLFLPDLIEKIISAISEKTYYKEAYINIRIIPSLDALLMKQKNSIKKITVKKKNLHKLRIKYKKYRYILEIYNQFMPNDKTIQTINNIKLLQDKLGILQDLQSHIKLLKEIKPSINNDSLIKSIIKIFKKEKEREEKMILPLLLFYKDMF